MAKTQRPRSTNFHTRLMLLALVVVLAGCASMASERLSKGLAGAMLNQDDPDIVRDGAPAYLLLVDSLIRGDDQDRKLLMTAASLYGAYAAGMTEDPDRKKRLSRQARTYASKAFCLGYPQLCRLEDKPFSEFERQYHKATVTDKALWFHYASSWAGWIQAHSKDWNAVASLPKVQLLLERLVEEDPGFHQGRAQLYLAVMKSQLPPTLGGKPEAGRAHFEQAIKHSDGRDLIVKVEYARYYARLTFNQALHDRLLNEVLQADPYQENLTLSNVLAKEKAAKLLSEDYF